MAQFATLVRKYEQLQQDYEKVKKERDDERSKSSQISQTEIDELTEKLEKAKLKETESNSSIEKLQSDLENIKMRLNSKESELKSAENEIEEMKKELESYKGRAESEGDKRQRMDEQLQSQATDFNSQLTTKDKEIRNLKAEIQRINQMLQTQKNEYTTRLTTKDMELESKDSEIDRLMRDADFKGKQSQSQYDYQLTQERNKLQASENRCFQIQQHNDKLQQDYQELRSNLNQANQRARDAESCKIQEVDKLKSENAKLHQAVESQGNKILQKDHELSRLEGEFDSQKRAFVALQQRFDRIVQEKKQGDAELNQVMSTAEESVRELSIYGEQFKSARSEIDRWQQAATQKDQQITQLQSEMQSIRDELRVRSEQVKAHEKTITNFTERNTKLSGRLAETEAKCERLEGEVNKVNRGKLLNRTGEQQVPLDQRSSSPYGNQPQPSAHQRHNSGGQRADAARRGYDRVPMNDNPAQYQQHKPYNPMDATPSHHNYQGGQDRNAGGYHHIPGPAQDPRSPPLNQMNNPWSPPAGQTNQPNFGAPQHQSPYGLSHQQRSGPLEASGGHSPYGGLEQSYRQRSGPLEGGNSDPCPMCGKRFANSDQLALHAATCNYDPTAH